MFRNWPAICAEENDMIRFLAATTTDQRILEGLQKGFPQLFCPKESVLLVPASLLRAYVARYHSPKDDRFLFEVNWHNAVDHYGIPYAAKFHPGVPKEISQQLLGQILGSGMKIQYHDIKCVVVYLWPDFSSAYGYFGEPIEKIPQNLITLSIVPARFIDFTC